MRTLMDSARSDRPQRRTALNGKKNKVEIAALSETHLAEEGLFKEVGATLFSEVDARKKSGVKNE